jgi:cell division protein FtsI (penicillin-binding protein 3)
MRIVFAISAALFLAVIARVTLLQTAQAEGLIKQGKAQRTSETVLKASRGTIFDRNGNEMAISVPRTTLTANPRLVVDPAGTATTLSQLLSLAPDKEQALQLAFTAKDKTFVYVGRQVDEKLAAAVMALKLPGIASVEEDQRELPSGNVGISLVGRTDIDGVGTAGLEKQYDQLLTGVDGERTREHDNKGRTIAGADTTTKDSVPGQDLVLTVDRSLQFQVEQIMLAAVDKPTVLAKGGTAVVIDTKTGEILATVNVARGADGKAVITAANNAAVEAHEPGSVAKVFSLSASLNEGVTTPATYIDVPGYLVFDKGTKYEHTIHDAESHVTGSMSLRDILVQSSNIGTWLTAQQLGSEKLDSYLTSFGFGKSTGLGFPDESAGLIKPWQKWQGTEKATVAYGYGYSATALQLAAAVNTIANGGVYVAPKLVMDTIDAKGVETSAPASATHTVVSPSAAADMTSMMRDVVCSSKGTGNLAKVPGMAVAGKTGTAYKIQKGGGYVGADGTKAYYASFVGFFPAAAPQVTILVSIDEPDPASNDRFGGTASAPVFVDIAQAAIHELQITPTPGDTGCADSVR